MTLLDELLSYYLLLVPRRDKFSLFIVLRIFVKLRRCDLMVEGVQGLKLIITKHYILWLKV